MAGGPRGAVQGHVAKLWAKYTRVDHAVTRTVSPNNHDLFTPWVKSWPEKMKHKITDNALDFLPGALIIFGIVSWSNSTYHHEQIKLRD